MLKILLIFFSFLMYALIPSLISANCCCSNFNQSVDISLGWRRDHLRWKTPHLKSSYLPGHADSRILFRKIDLYTISGNVRWLGSEYYVRLSGEYGLSQKGRAREHFFIKSPCLCGPVSLRTSDRIKRRSEVYDFNLAVGYPFLLYCHRLVVAPMIGFSFHRQHLRVKPKRSPSSFCSSRSSSSSPPAPSPDPPGSPDPSDSASQNSSVYSYFYSSFFHFPYSSDSSSSNDSFSSFYESIYSDDPSCFYCPPHCVSSSDFCVKSSNPFASPLCSNPFASPSCSDQNIASALGLRNPRQTSMYRFTWYGFYLATDIAYALDSSWTLFTELEYHFYDNCHRKRKSWTGVYYVDNYHHKGWAYGFNTLVGTTYSFPNCWYTILTVDFNWWKGHSRRDELRWKTVGVKWGVGYMY